MVIGKKSNAHDSKEPSRFTSQLIPWRSKYTCMYANVCETLNHIMVPNK